MADDRMYTADDLEALQDYVVAEYKDELGASSAADMFDDLRTMLETEEGKEAFTAEDIDRLADTY